uniref:Ig-like domain-containing protein n=1 Tax=Astyanax mexicanus TaxID=7994 RepID=A0A3B1ISN1_ASTMX
GEHAHNSTIYTINHSVTGKSMKMSDADLQVQTVKIGENVTLKCEQSSFRDSQKALSWYKQSFGKLPQFIVRAAENNQDPRFARSFKERFKMISNEEQMNLKIINTVEEDAGTYFCVKVNDQVVEFGSGTLLLFPESVTLQCSVLMATLSCSGDHSVYWFRPDSGEPRPGIIFTHGDSSSPCTRSSETVSPTQSCIYKLPKNNLSLSDAGTYYCAVAACGEILYGTGTKLHVKGKNLEWLLSRMTACCLPATTCDMPIIYRNGLLKNSLAGHINFSGLKASQTRSGGHP